MCIRDSFNTVTGQLSGTPSGADVGTYTNIVIRVSDGIAGTNLAAFSISVIQVATGSATISWIPPTENTDGTPLIDLGGYRIYYGTNSSSLDRVITINNVGTTRYVVDNLTSGTYYFGIRAFNRAGTESAMSGIASKTIS